MYVSLTLGREMSGAHRARKLFQRVMIPTRVRLALPRRREAHKTVRALERLLPAVESLVRAQISLG